MTEVLEDYAAERALLGALFLDRDAVAAVSERIQPEAFALPRHADLYRAFASLFQRRVPPDVVTVCGELNRQGWNDDRIDLADIAGMMIEAPFGCHAPYYADIVVEQARARAITDAGLTMVKEARTNPSVDPAEVVHSALAHLPTLGAATTPGPVPYAELTADYEERIHRIKAGEVSRTETLTGFRLLNHTLRGGFRRGELILLGARPSMGKTALALQLAHHAARSGAPVIIFSAEMSAASLIERAVAEVSGVPPRMVEDNRLTDERHNALLHATERTGRLPIRVDDTSGITIDQMIVRVQRAQAMGTVSLVIFDYLELAGDTVKGDSEERRVAEIGRKLKHLARVCDVPVLALCQLSRQPESRAGNVPRLSDLRYSGALEAHADVVLFLYRHDYYVTQRQAEHDPNKAGIAEVIVAKHRNGPTGTISLRFHDDTMTFTELDAA